MRRVTLLLLVCLPPTLAAQWQLQASHTTADLRGIDNVGHGIAWASGSHGTVLRTLDGGATWQPCATPPDAEALDLRGIQAFDKDTAIVMSSGKGNLSRLYKTSDGCQTWKLLFTNPDKDGFWDALQFQKTESKLQAEGVLIGDPVQGTFALFESSNQGSTWERWTGGPHSLNPVLDPKLKQASALVGEGLFAASNESLALWSQTNFIFVTGGSSGAKIRYSEVAGSCQELGGRCTLKFEQIKLTSFQMNVSSGAFAIASKNHSDYFPLRLMIVGGDYKKPDVAQGTAVFLSSRDGFHVPFTSYFDIISPTTPPHGYRSAVAYDAPTNTWITVGPNGTDVSTDDGRKWRALKPSPEDDPEADQHWNALSLPFVVGPHGRIGTLRPDALKKPAN